jgi:hypothetical protein
MCHCGHHKDTHFDGGKGACLGIGCNHCKSFRDDTKSDMQRPPPPVRPDHGSWCECYGCRKYREWWKAHARGPYR